MKEKSLVKSHNSKLNKNQILAENLEKRWEQSQLQVTFFYKARRVPNVKPKVEKAGGKKAKVLHQVRKKNCKNSECEK